LKKIRPGQRHGYQPPETKCVKCRKKKRVYQRVRGEPICRECSNLPKWRCAKCGQKKIINYHDQSQGPICLDCYDRTYAICTLCGQVGEIVQRLDDDKLICRSCYQPPLHRCSCCGRIAPLARKNPALCHTCYGRLRYKNNHKKCPKSH